MLRALPSWFAEPVTLDIKLEFERATPSKSTTSAFNGKRGLIAVANELVVQAFTVADRVAIDPMRSSADAANGASSPII